MSRHDLGHVEKKAARGACETMTVGNHLSLPPCCRPIPGASSVARGKRVACEKALIEPVPDRPRGDAADSEGERLANELPATKLDPGSGGGDSTFN